MNVNNLEIVITDVVQPLRTSVKTGEQSIPNSSSLSINYPNPFVGHTTVQTRLNRDRTVDIRLYNLLGEHIKLYRNLPNHGEIELNLSGLPAGMYLYEIFGQESHVSNFGKMMILY
ncbi:T9SS type A sorting domain-containing protein [candidate division KSB1 bacterium]|nr:T9SS type A sorting domain-containing protein [candidate division KSB1 bacterium]